MKKIFFFFFLALPNLLNAQTYFQQEVNHNIEAILDVNKGMIHVTQKLNYHNNSPDALEKIILHLWANAYANKSTDYAIQQLKIGMTDFQFANRDQLGGYSKLVIAEEGEETSIYRNYNNKIDIIEVPLKEVLHPSEERDFLINYSIKIPYLFSRMGKKDNYYQMAQWYPKPAVYDHNGWHPMSYLDMGEFYSEYGDYKVKLTVPNNFTVAHTGIAIDESVDPEKKVLSITAKNIHDFAWFCGPDLKAFSNKIQINNKEIECKVYHRSEHKVWDHALSMTEAAIRYYSKEVGDYPYPQMSVVEGMDDLGSGMEYPMLTIIDNTIDSLNHEHLIVHEVGHNWFYSILGFNERDYPWLDEGFNSYIENKYFKDNPHESRSGYFYMGSGKSAYQEYLVQQMRRNKDQAINLHSEAYSPINYGLDVYSKSAEGLAYLENYLGKKTMRKCIRNLYKNWQHKHPSPEDVQRSFEKSTKKDLSWFFSDWVLSDGRVDFKIKSIQHHKNKTKVSVASKYERAYPINVAMIKDDKIIENIWVENPTTETLVEFSNTNFDEIRINPEVDLPEQNFNNNQIKNKGLFPKLEPIKMKFFGGFENPRLSQLFFIPTIGYNDLDQLYTGVTFTNSFFPSKKTRWLIAPNYAFADKKLVGMFAVEHDVIPNGDGFRKMTFGLTGKKFGYKNLDNYYKLSPYVQWHFNASNTDQKQAKLELRYHHIWEENLISDGLLKSRNIAQLKYSLSNNFTLRPSNLDLMLEYHSYDKLLVPGNNSYLKLAGSYDAKFMYKSKRYVDFRIFAGTFLKNDRKDSASTSSVFSRGSFGLTFQNPNDYAYEEFFFGRGFQSGIAGQQIYARDGGFKNALGTQYNYGQSNHSMLAINLAFDLPINMPWYFSIKPYVDMAYYPSKSVTSAPFENVFDYSGGIEYDLGSIGGIYFPLINSNGIQQIYDAESSYLDRISFNFNFNLFNIWKLLDETDI